MYGGSTAIATGRNRRERERGGGGEIICCTVYSLGPTEACVSHAVLTYHLCTSTTVNIYSC